MLFLMYSQEGGYFTVFFFFFFFFSLLQGKYRGLHCSTSPVYIWGSLHCVLQVFISSGTPSCDWASPLPWNGCHPLESPHAPLPQELWAGEVHTRILHVSARQTVIPAASSILIVTLCLGLPCNVQVVPVKSWIPEIFGSYCWYMGHVYCSTV